MTATILEGDCRDVLRTLPARSVQTAITSPPYFGLRDYGTGEWEGGDVPCDHRQEAWTTDSGDLGPRGSVLSANEAKSLRRSRGQCRRCGARRVDRQIGLEPTPDEFVGALVEVFREVRRALRDDGTVWLNLGDSYNAYNGNRGGAAGLNAVADQQRNGYEPGVGLTVPALKPKDLIGIPWMVAFALRADGWYLRSDIVWAKPNPMPESVTDRPTRSHEYVFLLSKKPRYFYDSDAIRESAVSDHPSGNGYARHERVGYRNADGTPRGQDAQWKDVGGQRNKRSVWTVATQPYAGAHFATFPPKLIEPCVLAGSSPMACGDCGAAWRRVVEKARFDRTTDRLYGGTLGHNPSGTVPGSNTRGMPDPEPRTLGWESSCEHNDDTGQSVVLDPFAGAGTVGVVCGWHGRDFIGIELNPKYAQMARDRIALEGRPGGPPNGHEAQRVLDGQLGFEVL